MFWELAASAQPGGAAGLGRVARRALSIVPVPLGIATSILCPLPAPSPRLRSAHGLETCPGLGSAPGAGANWVPLSSG